MIVSDSELRQLLLQAAAEAAAYAHAQPAFILFARAVERVVTERTNPRIVLLRKRWLPVRVLRHYRALRTWQSRADALRLAWRFARA